MDQGLLPPLAHQFPGFLVIIPCSAASKYPAGRISYLDNVTPVEGAIDSLDTHRQQAGQTAAIQQGAFSSAVDGNRACRMIVSAGQPALGRRSFSHYRKAGSGICPG